MQSDVIDLLALPACYSHISFSMHASAACMHLHLGISSLVLRSGSQIDAMADDLIHGKVVD